MTLTCGRRTAPRYVITSYSIHYTKLYDDEERNLTAFGRKQSVQMAQWLATRLPRLDRVLVSPYVRAQQTWQTIRDFLPATTEVGTLDDLVPHGHADRVADYLRALELQGGNDNRNNFV